MRSPDRFPLAALAALLALANAPAALAADLYVTGGLGYSLANGDTKSDNSASTPSSGSDSDSSPVFGGAIGMSFKLSELIPVRMRIPSFDIPYFPGKSWHVAGSEDFRFPGWRTSWEVEAQTGRDFELITKGPSLVTPVISNVSSHSFMTNFRLDVPIQAPLHVFFGRLPMLEPVTLYGGVGAGASLNEIEASDSVVGKDSDQGFTFAYQFKGGIGYALTDNVHLSAGYRYYDLGELEVGFSNGGSTAQVSTEVVAHEITSGITVHFYRVPFLSE